MLLVEVVKRLDKYDSLGGFRGTALEVRAPEPTNKLLVSSMRTTLSSENSL